MNHTTITLVASVVCVIMMCLLLIITSTKMTASQGQLRLVSNSSQTALVVESETGGSSFFSYIMAITYNVISAPFRLAGSLFTKSEPAIESSPFAVLPSDFTLPTNNDDVTNLSENTQTVGLNASLYIQSIIINTNPAGRVVCEATLRPYEFFVILPDGSSLIDDGCGNATDYIGYAIEISQYLSETYNMPLFTGAELDQVPIFWGDGEAALAELAKSDTPTISN